MIHLYGFILGLAIVIGIHLVTLQAKRQTINIPGLSNLVWVGLLGGILGARIYHVITDYNLYQHAFWDIFKIWQGGLSIIGAIMGGMIAIWSWTKINHLHQPNHHPHPNHHQLSFKKILDLAVFGLPVAQAIGRLGNFINQELYGLPTTLPWGIYIQPLNRLPSYENFSHFHPLFLYEMIFMLVFAGGVWVLAKSKRFSGFSIGSGKLFFSYIFYYSFIRFWLDFIRIDKTHFLSTNFSINQIFLIILMMGVGSYWIIKTAQKSFYVSLISFLFLLSGCGLFWFKDISSPPINPDEVVWVLDARFFQFRAQKNWDKFVLTNKALALGWSHDQYRLIDQPQLGKYLYGFIIKAFKLDPWDPHQVAFLYQDFASAKLSLGSLEAIGEKYQDLATSIYLLRILGSVVSFMGIAAFGVGIYLFTKSRSIGGLTSIFLFFHPTLFYWYRLAVPNNIQMLLIILALSLMMFLLNSIKPFNLKRALRIGNLLWVLVGVLIAGATSIKLNGIFLLVFPAFIWYMQDIKQCFFHKVVDQNLIQNVIHQIKAYLSLWIGFLMTFYFLEPELWLRPLGGLQLLFGARWAQHRRFLAYFENYSFLESIWFLLIQFLKISDLKIVKILLVFFLLWGMVVLVRRLSIKKWVDLAWLLLFMVIVNAGYANVGFDRYAEWSIFVFSFLSALGGVDIFLRIGKKIKTL